MPRLASERIGAFYPTPLDVIDLIAASVGVEEQNQGHKPLHIGDFSCGEGLALERLAQRWAGTETWGNEIERNRYEAAALRLDHCTHGPQETLEVTGELDMIFLNPPYLEGIEDRLEVEHVAQAFGWLKLSGLFVAVVPQHILAKEAFWLKWYRWMRSTYVRRFPDGEFERYRQFVVFGVKVYREPSYHGVDRKARKQLIPFATDALESIPVLNGLFIGAELSRRGAYGTNPMKEIGNSLPAASDILADVEDMSPVLQTDEWVSLTVPREHLKVARPAMPVQATHVIQLAAAGMLNGQEIELDGETYLVTGSSEKYLVVVDTEDTDEVTGKVTRRTTKTEKAAYQIRMFSLGTGRYVVVDSRQEADYQQFIKEHVEDLILATNEAMPSRYDLDYGEFAGYYDLLHAPRELPGLVGNGLLTAQKHVAAAMCGILRRGNAAILDGEMGVGKGARLTTPILMPTGWVKAGDVSVGDRLVAVDGKPTKVVGVYPQGVKDVYRITFSDGTSTVCDEEHLWEVNTPLRKWRDALPMVLSTGDLLKRGLKDINSNRRFFIPLVVPVKFDRQDVPLDPFVFGVLLGDGSFTQTSVTIANPDVGLMTEVGARTEIRARKKPGRCQTYSFIGLQPVLRELGLMGRRAETKFVPECYKFNSPEVRLAVLQGLLDTDGYVENGKNSIEYCTVSPQLRDDVVFLVQSLGGVATVSVKPAPEYTYNGEKRVGQRAYRVFVRLPGDTLPFLASEKRGRYKPKTKYQPARAIESIEYVGQEETVCFKVDHPRELFVIEHFLVTHNTFTSIAVAAITSGMLDGRNAKIVVMAPAVVAPKWVEELEAILRGVPNLKVGLVGATRTQAHACARRGGFDDGGGATASKRKRTKKPILDARELMEHDGPAVLVISYEIAKNGAPWRHAPHSRRKFATWEEDEDVMSARGDQVLFTKTVQKAGEVDIFFCPDCGEELRTRHGLPWSVDVELIPHDHEDSKMRAKRKQRRCPHCRAQLWETMPFRYGGRWPVAEYLSQHYGKRYHLILDEVHNLKGSDADQALAAYDLICNAKKVIAMTGTLYNGFARSLFYLMYRLSPGFKQLYDHDEANTFVSQHGFMQTIVTSTTDVGRHGYSGYGRNNEREYSREAPGATAQMVAMLVPYTCFLTLADIGVELPPRTEIIVPVTPCEEMWPGLADLTGLHKNGKAALVRSNGKNKGPHARWFNAALGWPDHPVQEKIVDPLGTFEGLISGALTATRSLPKEVVLLNIIREELGQERGVAVFFEQVNRRNAMPRVQAMLEREEIASACLTVRIPAAERVPWIQQHVKDAERQGKRFVLLANGTLIKEGVDLLWFPSMVAYGQHYNITESRQMFARSHRLGQTKPVKIFFLFYEGTQQERALLHIAVKLRAADQLAGQVAEGLADFGSEEDFMMDLMRAARDAEEDGVVVKLSDLMQSVSVSAVYRPLPTLVSATAVPVIEPRRTVIVPKREKALTQLTLF